MTRKRFRLYRPSTPYLFLLPFFLILILFDILPILATFGISFTGWDGISRIKSVGLANYRTLFTPGTTFIYKTVLNTAIILFAYLPISIALSLVMAEIICTDRLPLRKFFQLANFLPYITMPVALGILWAIIFDWKYGSVNSALVTLGIIKAPINFLGIPMFARGVVSLMYIWKNNGYFVVMIMAGIMTIPAELNEAAVIDGASRVQRFFRITLPLLRPILAFLAVTSVIYGFQMFDEPYLLFSGGFTSSQPFGGPKNSVLTMIMYMFDASFRNLRFGYGASIAVATFAFIGAFTLLIRRLRLF